MEKTKFNTIDEYISTFPKETQSILSELRNIISSAATNSEEKISYNMPTYFLNGNLVHFAANKNHIGFYPTPSAIIKFEKELSNYKTSKGAIQFQLNKPLPKQLIKNIVKFRVSENQKKDK
jgi:uncharacterized protein YdhG (YjbR/CyaY superfamily)